MRIKDISEENRPRERLKKFGSTALSDAELLAIIFRTGHKEENVIDMSNRLLSTYGLANLSGLSLKELQKIKGIGFAKACQLVTIFELNKRYSLAGTEKVKLTGGEDVYKYMSPKMNDLKHEQFIVLCLDSKNRVTKEIEISKGTLNQSLVHPREVFKEAIRESANSIIVVHNHPSGDPTPSEPDLEVTKVLIEAGELLGIKVLDHVIVGSKGWWSWQER